ncbi:hypothetical protein [Planococcus lenghuensis]|uniref:Uncharacterized protein n=1 Tax=Planococcus lenghuensis TaxID=2213202 RepID=A0A1Q2KYP6_9BACL|nr:hypothetical protein [Planococcus lenghuensis]AQQ53273.1 hypothetical protein B0X71_09400 [Planococcus lenghuensis]
MLVAGSYFLFWNHTSVPETSDVSATIQSFSTEPMEIMAIEEVEEDWVAFFKDDKRMYVGLLKRNLIGQWRLADGLGNEGPIGEVLLKKDNQANGISWGVSGLSKGDERLYSFYYGSISNPEVDEVLLSVGGRKAEAVQFIEGEKDRFFFLRETEKPVPYEFTAIADGEIIDTES